MRDQFALGGIIVDVIKKDIKNIHLSVYPPSGRVRISAPLRMKTDTIRVFAISKLAWIKQQRKKLQEQERQAPSEYLDRESHYVWGKRYLLNVIEKDGAPSISVRHNHLVLRQRPGTTKAKSNEVLEAFYRAQLKKTAAPFISKWERHLDVKVERLFIQRMKTKWGSCSPTAASIRLNAELAKKPKECLEYIVVHELVHLREPTHNKRFVALMDQFMPKWRFMRDELNRLPVRHESWGY